jgi:hypothetical protein
VPQCTPDCSGKQCGGDGCGGICGTCPPSAPCNAGLCGSSCDCGTRVCGTGPTGCSCGTCNVGEICTPAGQCLVPANANGQWCGPSADCPAFIPDPANPGEEIFNPDYSTCQHNQCASKFCLGAGAPGVFIDMPVCSRPCDIVEDKVNNKTGAAGADGIEDPNVPFSDCDNFSDGPGGANYVCVNFASPTVGSALSYCIPGSNFAACSANKDCAAGEQCMAGTIGGQLGERCMAKFKAGEWGTASQLGEACESTDPFAAGGLSYCESGWCFGLGCIDYCAVDSDCDTSSPGDCAGGTCANWSSHSCTADSDCSAFSCSLLGQQIFSNVPEYTADLCWPRNCDYDADCPGGFYCRYSWNGAFDANGLPFWENICLPQAAGGVAIGEACDHDPDDNIPGNTCANEDLCIAGYCSALCAVDADCGSDQQCVVNEFTVPLDDSDPDSAQQSLPLKWCQTYQGSKTACFSEATCADGESCDLYTVENVDAGTGQLDPDAPFFTLGQCTTSDSTAGAYGANCLNGADCETGWCLGADSATNTAGFCTSLCESAADCGQLAGPDGETYNGICTALLLGYGGDARIQETNSYVPLCQFTSASGADCSADFTCAAGEACQPLVISYGPNYDAKVDYRCLSNTNADASMGTTAVGGPCDPTLEDAEGNAIMQCASGLCFEEATAANAGYCSRLCDPANDTCAAAGTPDMKCLAVATIPRRGAYTDNTGEFYACRKDIDCGPCFTSGFCPGDRVCVNLGQDANLLADYRCVPACATSADCAGEAATTCSTGKDGLGGERKGCFALAVGVPVNYCL